VLNAEAVVVVPRGGAYPVCSAGLSAGCDPGATASLRSAGDLNGRVSGQQAGGLVKRSGVGVASPHARIMFYR
jgi:hypothetical protein